MVRDNAIPVEEREGLSAEDLAWGVDDRYTDDVDRDEVLRSIGPELLARADEELRKRGFPMKPSAH